MGNAFESRYRENATRRRYVAPKSNAFPLPLFSYEILIENYVKIFTFL